MDLKDKHDDSTLVSPSGDEAGEGFVTVPELERTLGQTEERYRAHKLLGAGGMGEVWLCRDERIGRPVALKRLHERNREQEMAQRRFLREARVQALVEHPSVVPVYDMGLSPEGSPYFTMRRIRGHTLAEIMESLAKKDRDIVSRYSQRKLLTAYVNVCLAVHYAHRRGVVHRDLKPSNVMFGDFGEVYILDWGVAKILDEPLDPVSITLDMPLIPLEELPGGQSGGLTSAGDTIGTVGYMSPEQIKGQEITGRSDVYALGVILYEILTQARLHNETKWWGIIHATVKGITSRPPLEGVPPELDGAWREACALDPQDRYPHARALADAIESYLDGDRDMEQRRRLAKEHGDRAVLSADRALSREVPVPERDAARVEATEEVMRALALDPDHGLARRTLARLLLDAPDELPPQARADMERSVVEARATGLKYSVWAYLSWVLAFPLVILVGVRNWLPVGFALGCSLFSLFFSTWMWRRKKVSFVYVLPLAVAHFATVAMFSSWLGPFVMVPVAASISILGFTTQVGRKMRLLFLIMGCLTVVVPFSLEALGLIPPSYAFQGSNLLLLQRALSLPPLPTIVALLYTNLSFLVIAAIYFGRIRDALSRAEKRLYLHSWHMSHMAGGSDKHGVMEQSE